MTHQYYCNYTHEHHSLKQQLKKKTTWATRLPTYGQDLPVCATRTITTTRKIKKRENTKRGNPQYAPGDEVLVYWPPFAPLSELSAEATSALYWTIYCDRCSIAKCRRVGRIAKPYAQKNQRGVCTLDTTPQSSSPSKENDAPLSRHISVDWEDHQEGQWYRTRDRKKAAREARRRGSLEKGKVKAIARGGHDDRRHGHQVVQTRAGTGRQGTGAAEQEGHPGTGTAVDDERRASTITGSQTSWLLGVGSSHELSSRGRAGRMYEHSCECCFVATCGFRVAFMNESRYVDSTREGVARVHPRPECKLPEATVVAAGYTTLLSIWSAKYWHSRSLSLLLMQQNRPIKVGHNLIFAYYPFRASLRVTTVTTSESARTSTSPDKIRRTSRLQVRHK